MNNQEKTFYEYLISLDKDKLKEILIYYKDIERKLDKNSSLIEIHRLYQLLDKTNINLSNPNFISKSPQHIVDKARQTVLDTTEKLDRIDKDEYHHLKEMFEKNDLNDIYLRLNLGFVNYEREQKHRELNKKYDNYDEELLYSEEWFNYVYETPITFDEFIKLPKPISNYFVLDVLQRQYNINYKLNEKI